MGNQVDRKFTWVIKNFSTLQSEKIYSDEFVISGCKWRLLAFPEGNNSPNNFSLYLIVADYESLPSECKRNVFFTFTLVNQLHERLSRVKVARNWLDQKAPDWGFTSMISLIELHAKDGGYLLNDELKIVIELYVLEVIGKLDVPEESKEATKPLKTMNHNDDDEDIPGDLVDVNGFQVLPSQVGFVRRIFGKHPDTAVECCTKNQDLRTSYINVLFTLIKMLYKRTQDQSTDDLSDAEAALAYMKSVGFKVNWLEKKLVEVKENKKRCDQVTELEQQLQDLMNKYTSVGQQLEKERAEIKKAASPDISFNDVV
ncbi:PREDICTED: MATH domain and coiled-coil domain-containing protein At3g58270-like [Camelina sativa]|uniref:MATH domain and coiled-coil domain-containing protein At3g58270-like n=1 Tax=Camelina sativa TaxID=90675 RepID=A0ABM0SL71_CAMSA|nr:PREDICTED: MATH domain and coiled-coil domain-containing protein At3g58270-like [Camelina sativa]